MCFWIFVNLLRRKLVEMANLSFYWKIANGIVKRDSLSPVLIFLTKWDSLIFLRFLYTSEIAFILLELHEQNSYLILIKWNCIYPSYLNLLSLTLNLNEQSSFLIFTNKRNCIYPTEIDWTKFIFDFHQNSRQKNIWRRHI